MRHYLCSFCTVLVTVKTSRIFSIHHSSPSPPILPFAHYNNLFTPGNSSATASALRLLCWALPPLSTAVPRRQPLSCCLASRCGLVVFCALGMASNATAVHLLHCHRFLYVRDTCSIGGFNPHSCLALFAYKPRCPSLLSLAHTFDTLLALTFLPRRYHFSSPSGKSTTRTL